MLENVLLSENSKFLLLADDPLYLKFFYQAANTMTFKIDLFDYALLVILSRVNFIDL